MFRDCDPGGFSSQSGRTIADLEATENIAPKHLSEAIQYRTLDRSHWT
jgi:predicted ATPase with chaperone activity